MGFKYSLVTDLLSMIGYDLAERPREALQAISDGGLDGADITGNPSRVNTKEVKQIADSLGLDTPAVVGAWAGWHAGESRELSGPDEDARRHAVQYSKTIVDMAVELGARVVPLAACPYRPEYPSLTTPVEVLRQNMVRSSIEICQYAANHDVLIAFEPINRFEAYAGFGNTVQEAMGMVDEVGMDNFGIMADLFHVNIEDQSVPGALRMAGDRLFHIHLADSNRSIPGTGHIDFNAVITVLRDIDYGGYVALDAFPIRPTLQQYLEGSMRYMKSVEEAVELQAGLYTS